LISAVLDSAAPHGVVDGLVSIHDIAGEPFNDLVVGQRRSGNVHVGREGLSDVFDRAEKRDLFGGGP